MKSHRNLQCPRRSGAGVPTQQTQHHNTITKPQDPVFNILETMLRSSPEQSYKRLNPALRSTLTNCIDADMLFYPDTFRRIHDELRGSLWFGDGAGSHVGEHFYSMACAVNHTTACISFENFAKRPAVLWEEVVRTPERLHVGSRFSWQGHHVTVTSMRKDSLVACTYKDHVGIAHGVSVGATINDYSSREGRSWTITHSKQVGAGWVLRAIKASPSRGERDVSKRFTIPYSDIAEFRKTSKARLKRLLEEIAACDPDKDSKRLTKVVNAGHFQHWQLEEIRAAFSERKAWKSDQGRVEKWRAGENGEFLDVGENLLRVRGDRVECSNGNGVSRASVERTLPVILARRRDFGPLKLPLDGYTVNGLSLGGVRIGCTNISWPEVDRLVATLGGKAVAT